MTKPPTRHVTIGDLRRSRMLLEVGCEACGHCVYIDPETLPFYDDQSVPLAHKRMRCNKCGRKDRGYSRPDARVRLG